MKKPARVTMYKLGRSKRVHPANLRAHLRAGWHYTYKHPSMAALRNEATMSNRITAGNLTGFCTYANKVLGTPDCAQATDGAVQPGHVHHRHSDGQWCIVMTTDRAGNTRTLVKAKTARDCFELAHAWLDGFMFATEPAYKGRAAFLARIGMALPAMPGG